MNTDSVDFCGDKNILSVALNNSASDWLNVKNQDVIEFSPPSDTVYFGVAQGLITIEMASY